MSPDVGNFFLLQCFSNEYKLLNPRQWPEVSDSVAHLCDTTCKKVAQCAKKCDTNHIPRATPCHCLLNPVPDFDNSKTLQSNFFLADRGIRMYEI